jgi:hypothetical protein
MDPIHPIVGKHNKEKPVKQQSHVYYGTPSQKRTNSFNSHFFPFFEKEKFIGKNSRVYKSMYMKNLTKNK